MENAFGGAIGLEMAGLQLDFASDFLVQLVQLVILEAKHLEFKEVLGVFLLILLFVITFFRLLLEDGGGQPDILLLAILELVGDLAVPGEHLVALVLDGEEEDEVRLAMPPLVKHKLGLHICNRKVTEYRLRWLHVVFGFQGKDAVVPEFQARVLYQSIDLRLVVLRQLLYKFELVVGVLLDWCLNLQAEPLLDLLVALQGEFLVVEV